MVHLTSAAFFIVLVLCAAGLFSGRYHENWPQHIGLFGMGVTSLSGMYRVYQMDWVPPDMTVFAVSVALFGLGVVLKVLKFESGKRQNNDTDESLPIKTL